MEPPLIVIFWLLSPLRSSPRLIYALSCEQVQALPQRAEEDACAGKWRSLIYALDCWISPGFSMKFPRIRLRGAPHLSMLATLEFGRHHPRLPSVASFPCFSPYFPSAVPLEFFPSSISPHSSTSSSLFSAFIAIIFFLLHFSQSPSYFLSRWKRITGSCWARCKRANFIV